MDSDRIEKQIQLRAPRSRVWQALSDAGKFGEWFGMKLSGPFATGVAVQGEVTMKSGNKVRLEIAIQKMEPERLMSWRWHPYAIDPAVDYSAEPSTLVTFELVEVTDGTLLTVVESGFDRLPPERRQSAFRANENGWEIQMKAIERYVSPTT